MKNWNAGTLERPFLPSRKNISPYYLSLLYNLRMIDTHIPPPPSIPRTATRRQYGCNPINRDVLSRMNVNDSIHISGDAGTIQNARNTISAYGRKTDRQFITRAEGAGIRLWRIA